MNVLPRPSLTNAAHKTGPLYTPALLALATSVARYPYDARLPHRAEARSRLCGSRIVLALATDGAGRIETIGMKLEACAVGQAAAAIFAEDVVGMRLTDVDAQRVAVARWLAGEGKLQDGSGLERLSHALPYSSRHGAIALPWDAAVRALTSAQQPE